MTTKQKKTKQRKMTRVEKKEFNDILKQKKAAKKIRKTVATTLRWMDIKSVKDEEIVLERNNKTAYIQGIKLTPHNIFLDEPEIQQMMINQLRQVFNQINMDLYFAFVYSPVDVDDNIALLKQAMQTEDDMTIRNMLSADINKYRKFVATHKEKEFFIMIRDTDKKRLKKNLQDLSGYFASANMFPKQLNQRDFYAYIMYVFENTLINDYVFSRGVFSVENVIQQYNAKEDKYELNDTTTDFSQFGEPILNIKQNANMIQRSKLAPTFFKETHNHLEIGDKYVRFLLVTSFPSQLLLGILTEYLNDPHVKVFMTVKSLSLDLVQMINKEFEKNKQALDRTKNETERQRLAETLATQHDYINDLILKNDKTHNVTIAFAVNADSLKELDERTANLQSFLRMQGWKTIIAKSLQQDTLRLLTPFFLETQLDQVVEDNYGCPLTSECVAGLYPYIFETLNDKYGMLIGEELQNGGKIILDPFFYMHQPEIAKVFNRVNGNFIIAGRAGSGKTVTMNLITRNFIRKKTKIIWVDPENKNMRLTKRYGGTFIEWGMEDNIINPFDLKQISFEDDEERNAEKEFDTRLAIINVTNDIKQIFMYLFPHISDEELACIGQVIKYTYAMKGFAPKGKDERGKEIYESFKGKTYEDMPTFTDFNNALKTMISQLGNQKGYDDEIRILSALLRKNAVFMNEYSVYFNGTTTVKLQKNGRKIISFGTKRLQTLPQELANALYHVMFNYAWTECLDKKEESAFIVDEAHAIILQGKISGLLSQFVRRSRKYRNVMLIATQEPRDFADSRVLTEGKAIFNNSVYKIILGLNKDACEDLKKLEHINESEEWEIQQFTQGRALLMCGNRRIPINVIASEAELSDMGTMFD